MENTAHEPIPTTNERLPRQRKKATMYLWALIILVGGMFGFAYANSEFFIMICQKAGLLSTPPEQLRAEAVASEEIGRPLDVYFSANVNDGLPVSLRVEDRYQKAHVGETKIMDYHFTNLTNRKLYFRPVHDVYPIQAGKPDVMLLTKCFCFDMQKIEPNQTYSLPVEYTFTDKLEEDTRTIRMNYSLFPATKAAYEEWEATQEEGDPNTLPGKGEDFVKKELGP